MALKLKGSTSGFVALDSPAVAGNNTITLPDSNGSANQVWANDNTAGVTTYTQVTINRNGDIVTPGTLSIGGTITYEDVTNVDSVGIITARTDIHLGDKLVHYGDTNTAIRFPAADTITAETGGSERLRITSVGQVLVGLATARNTQMVVYGDGTDDNKPAILFQNPTTGTANNSTGIYIGGNHNDAHGYVWNYEAQALIFGTNNTEKLRITSAGKVGIGEDSPETLLHLKSATAPILTIQNTTNTSYTGIHFDRAADDTQFAIYSYDSSHGSQANNVQFYNYQSGALSFHTNSTERLTITAAGSVGVGTDNPNRKFTLYNDTTTRLNLKSLATSTVGLEFGDPADENVGYIVYDNTADSMQFGVNAGLRATITSAGNMGLGVVPSGWASAQAGDFYAFQAGTGAALFGRGSGDLDRGGISVNYYHTGSAQKYIGNGNANRIYLEDGAIVCSYAAANSSGAGAALTWVQRFKIDADGQFLIGTNATANSKPSGFSSRLQVEGTSATTSSISMVRNSNDDNGPYLSFGKSRGTAVNSNVAVSLNDPLGQIDWTGSDGSNAFNNFASIRCYVDATPGNADAPGRLSFYTTPDSSTTPTERMRITRNGSVHIGNYTNDGDDFSTHTNLWIGGNGNMYAETSAGGGKSFSMSQNAHIDAGGDWTYVNTDEASNIYHYAGDIGIRNTASGTAGNTLTWTNSGKFGVNGDFMWGQDWSNTLWDSSSENGWYYRRAEGSMQMANNTGYGYSLLYMNKNTTGGSNDYRYIDFYWDSSSKGSITGDGSNTAYNTSSDHRLKENIVDITDGITRLKQLKPRRFNWIADSTNTLQDGFIAHEVSSFIPEAVTGTKDRVVTQAEVDANTQPQNDTAGTPIYQQMDYAKVTPLLTAALQEAIAEIETLKTKVAALESA